MSRKWKRTFGRRQELRQKIFWHIAGAALFLTCLGGTAAAEVADDAMPTGGRVARGEAEIGAVVTDAAGKHILTIDQEGNRAIIDWASFDVGKDGIVQFRTWGKNAAGTRVADPSAMTLNRVAAGSGLSTIAGKITSTGNFLLTNPGGVYFADGATVDAAGIVASTAALDEEAFLQDGRLVFVQDAQAPNAAITVNGALQARTVLPEAQEVLQQAVLNIEALPLGMALAVTNNSIRIVADGDIQVGTEGRLQATERTTLADTSSVREKGYLIPDATTVREGSILLRADANADDVAADGVTAATVHLENPEASQIAALHVDVRFNPAITAAGVKGTAYAALGIMGAEDARFTQKDYVAGAEEAAALQHHVTGKDVRVSMLVHDAAQLEAIGDSTFGNLSGSYALGRDIDARETSAWNPGTGGKALGFAPIGTATQSFTGMLAGDGYAIYDLFLARPKENNVGVFAVLDKAQITDVALVDAVIAGNYNVGGIAGTARNGTVFDGVVLRKRDGSAREDATVTGTQENVFGTGSVGGLVGSLAKSAILHSQNGGTVTGGTAVGGLAGLAKDAEIYDSSNTGYTSARTNLENGQAVGVITAKTRCAGGLVGQMTGTASTTGAESTSVIGVRDTRAGTYNAGSVYGATDAGGLVGSLKGAVLRQAYNTNAAQPGTAVVSTETEAEGKSPYGSVRGKTYVGGLVGEAEGGRISVAWNAGNVTGEQNVGGIVGRAGASRKYRPVDLVQVYSGDNNTVAFAKDPEKAELAFRDGVVTGKENVGGLVGLFEKGCIWQAYSMSTVRAAEGADASSLGALAGKRTSSSAIFGRSDTDKVFSCAREAQALAPIGKDAAPATSDTKEALTGSEMMQAARFGWKRAGTGETLSERMTQNGDWLVFPGKTPPLLQAFLTPVEIRQQWQEDGISHALDLSDVAGCYGRASFSDAAMGKEVHQGGVKTLAERGEAYLASAWSVRSGAASDDVTQSSLYEYDDVHIWSPQSGVYLKKAPQLLIAAKPAPVVVPEEPEEPEEPETPVSPTQPEDPEGSETPVSPAQPEEPVTPAQPEDPKETVPSTQPEGPKESETPVSPTQPEDPGTTVQPAKPEGPKTPLPSTQPEEPQGPETPTEPITPAEKPKEPEAPVVPTEPEEPARPTDPGTQVPPIEPSQPQEPETTVPTAEPTQPTNHETPVQPIEPAQPKEPEKLDPPTTPTAPKNPAETKEPTKPETSVVPSQSKAPEAPAKPSRPPKSQEPKNPSEPGKPATPAVPAKPAEEERLPAFDGQARRPYEFLLHDQMPKTAVRFVRQPAETGALWDILPFRGTVLQLGALPLLGGVEPPFAVDGRDAAQKNGEEETNGQAGIGAPRSE